MSHQMTWYILAHMPYFRWPGHIYFILWTFDGTHMLFTLHSVYELQSPLCSTCEWRLNYHYSVLIKNSLGPAYSVLIIKESFNLHVKGYGTLTKCIYCKPYF